jgi:hypothetical protein
MLDHPASSPREQDDCSPWLGRKGPIHGEQKQKIEFSAFRR